jgi:ADP-ribose pyrophosphatase YjhB (NUDIX family)
MEDAVASDISVLVEQLARRIENPTQGLPLEVFQFVSSLTPMVNVDLLIKDAQGRNLLTWREDEHYGVGWQLPGGIVRFQETLTSRVKAVARLELGAEVKFDPIPVVVNEVIRPTRTIRGHFISFLYRCSLTTQPAETLRCKTGQARPGEWMWHAGSPSDLLAVHEIYRVFLMGERPRSAVPLV